MVTDQPVKVALADEVMSAVAPSSAKVFIGFCF